MALRLAELVEAKRNTRYFQSHKGTLESREDDLGCGLFRSLADMMPDGVVVQYNEQIVYANHAAAQLLEYGKASDLLAHSMMEYITPSQREVAEYRIHGVTVEKLGLPFLEYSLKTQGGRDIFVEMSSQPVLWKGQVAVQTLMRDVTTRKIKDDIFQTVSRAVEQLPDSVVITDPAGIIEYVNPYFEERFGYSSEQVCNHDFSVLEEHILSKDSFAELMQMISLGRLWRGELSVASEDGHVFWKQVSVSPVLAANGKISHFIAIMKDITEQKEIAENLEKALQAAEDANKAKSNFLANMSHEFRTPLNAIIGFNSLLANESGICHPKKVRDYASYALDGGNHMLALVNDLLDLAKVEAGEILLHNENFPISEAMTSVVRTVSGKALENGCKVTINCAHNFVLYADMRRIIQVLINIVHNAIKFSKGGNVTIETTLEDKAILRIADDGLGMSEEGVKQALRPFGQAEGDSYAKQYEGAGLGLPIASNLIELHEGALDIESELGRGTVVTLSLPMSRVIG